MPKPKPITTKGSGHHHDQLRPIRTSPRAWERDQSPPRQHVARRGEWIPEHHWGRNKWKLMKLMSLGKTTSSVCYTCPWLHMNIWSQNLKSMSFQTSIWTPAIAPFLTFCKVLCCGVYRYLLLEPISLSNEVYTIIIPILEMINWVIKPKDAQLLVVDVYEMQQSMRNSKPKTTFNSFL